MKFLNKIINSKKKEKDTSSNSSKNSSELSSQNISIKLTTSPSSSGVNHTQAPSSPSMPVLNHRLSSSCSNLPNIIPQKAPNLRKANTLSKIDDSHFDTMCRDYFPKATISKSSGYKMRNSNSYSIEYEDEDDRVGSYGMGSVLVGCFDTYDQKRREYPYM